MKSTKALVALATLAYWQAIFRGYGKSLCLLRMLCRSPLVLVRAIESPPLIPQFDVFLCCTYVWSLRNILSLITLNSGCEGQDILDDITSYGASRWEKSPNEHLSIDEKVRMTILCAELDKDDHGMRSSGAVQKLAWDFGISRGTVYSIYQEIKHGKTVFRKGRIYKDNIMDVLENHLALIDVVVDNKGRLSKRRMASKFHRLTGVKMSCDTLVRHPKENESRGCPVPLLSNA